MLIYRVLLKTLVAYNLIFEVLSQIFNTHGPVLLMCSSIAVRIRCTVDEVQEGARAFKKYIKKIENFLFCCHSYGFLISGGSMGGGAAAPPPLEG
jgi:hypothetical protein